MFPEPSSGLSLTRILSGISKSLNIANQVIPIYEQAKPMIKNVRKAYGTLKSLNLNSHQQNSPSSKKSNQESQTLNQKKTTNKTYSSHNNPSFFK